MGKMLLLDIAREKITNDYSKKTSSRKGTIYNSSAIDWLTQNANTLNKINYVDNQGNTIFHLLVKDLPFIVKDDRITSILEIKKLSDLFIRCINHKNNKGEIPLDIALTNLFCNKQSNKFSSKDDIFVNKTKIFLRYIEYLVINKSNTKKLQDKDILLDIALMCKTDSNLRIFTNILNHLDDEFKKDFVLQEDRLYIALDKLVVFGENNGVIKFVKWLTECYTKFKYTDFESYQEWNTKLFTTIKKMQISNTAKLALLSEISNKSNEPNHTKTNSYNMPREFYGITENMNFIWKNTR